MSVLRPTPVRFDPVSAAPLLSDLGFVASPDLPDRPGPAYLLVALRASPTLRHYDPEAVEYWVSDGGKGSRRTVTRSTRVPLESEFSWGLIRIVDRLHVTNEYLTFGGHLSVASVDGVIVAVFTSPAPMLRRGGHSQDWDEGAETLGAFFSRVLLAVDVAPGFEGRVAAADPVSRYCAFVADAMARYRASPMLRIEQPRLWTMLQAEERGLRENHPAEWAAGETLRNETAT